MTELEERLGYRFRDPALLELALTHASTGQLAGTEGASNERLEFLGDAVIELVISDELFRSHPDWPEGALTWTRAALVNSGGLAEHARALDVGRRAGLVEAHPLEEGRLADVGRVRVPVEGLALRHLQGAPLLGALEDARVDLGELLAGHGAAEGLGDLGLARPGVLEEHVVAGVVRAEGLGLRIPVGRAGERVGDDQRRRGQPVAWICALMRPSKLRLPESTEQTTRSPSLTASETSGGSGPELPMQVVQP